MKNKIYILILLLLQSAISLSAVSLDTISVPDDDANTVADTLSVEKAPSLRVVYSQDIKSVKMKDGSTYVGELKGKRPHGKGKLVFENGDLYDGNFVKGKMSGEGIYRYSDGRSYSGEFLNGKKHGQGTFQYNDGRVYDGGWQDDCRHGYGQMTYPNGDIYSGMWADDAREGTGCYFYADGSTYVGEAFTNPYDLPNEGAYTETCAGIGLVFFANAMLALEND